MKHKPNPLGLGALTSMWDLDDIISTLQNDRDCLRAPSNDSRWGDEQARIL